MIHPSENWHGQLYHIRIRRTNKKHIKLGGGFKYFLFSPLAGEWSNLTNMFQMDWNHQLGKVKLPFPYPSCSKSILLIPFWYKFWSFESNFQPQKRYDTPTDHQAAPKRFKTSWQFCGQCHPTSTIPRTAPGQGKAALRVGSLDKIRTPRKLIESW